MIKASIMGGSGYAGGELARLLLDHSSVELRQVTSRRLAGKPLHAAHPNLRGRSRINFVPMDCLESCDVLFCCLPHGESASRMAELCQAAEKIIDLAADFRLRDSASYRTW